MINTNDEAGYWNELESLVLEATQDQRRNYQALKRRVDEIEIELLDQVDSNKKERQIQRRILEARLSLATLTNRSIEEVIQIINNLKSIGFGGVLREATTIGRFARYLLNQDEGDRAQPYLEDVLDKLENFDSGDIDKQQLKRFTRMTKNLHESCSE